MYCVQESTSRTVVLIPAGPDISDAGALNFPGVGHSVSDKPVLVGHVS